MRKVLIITYYWPPAGGPGVQRVLKFAKYLPEFGWEPLILTVAHGDYPAVDESLCSEIPDGLPVYKTRTLEPFGTYRKVTGTNSDQEIPTYILNADNSDDWRRWRFARTPSKGRDTSCLRPRIQKLKSMFSSPLP